MKKRIIALLLCAVMLCGMALTTGFSEATSFLAAAQDAVDADAADEAEPTPTPEPEPEVTAEPTPTAEAATPEDILQITEEVVTATYSETATTLTTEGEEGTEAVCFIDTNKDGNMDVSENGYSTLAAAVAAANDGNTIMLLAHVTLTNTVEIKKALTIDGGEYTLSSGYEIDTLFSVAEGGSLSIVGGTFSQDVSSFCADGYAALPKLDGTYVVGEEPSATIQNLGAKTVEGSEKGGKGYYVYPGLTSGGEDMPLSFVMQYTADQTAEDMKTSPFADWYADFVITISGLKDDSITVDSDTYLAGFYGETEYWQGDWVKVVLTGEEIKEDTRYPVMMGVGMPQTYDYICSGVQEFLCAMNLSDDLLEENPNLKVTLELCLVDSSDDDKAYAALQSGVNIYTVAKKTFTADNFNPVEVGVAGNVDVSPAVKGAVSEAMTATNSKLADAFQNSNVTSPSLNVTITDLDTETSVTASRSMTLDISIKNSTGDTVEASGTAIELTFPASVIGLKKDDTAYIVHDKGDGTKYIHAATVDANGNATITNTNGFSAFTVSDNLNTVLDKAEAGDTIILASDVTTTGKITISKKITLDGNGRSIIADDNVENYSPWVVLAADGIVLKDLKIDSKNCAGGVKIENNCNVVFDNVSILNAQADALTVYGSLTINTYFKVSTNSSVIDARDGTVTVTDNTVFDMTSFRGNVSSGSDLTKAVDTEGKPFFCAYAGSTYYVNLDSVTSIPNGLTLLKDAVLKYSKTIKSATTINLNGKTLTIDAGKTLTVNNNLTINANGGTIIGSLVLGSTSATISGPEGLNVISTGTGTGMFYVGGEYKVGVKFTLTASGGANYLYTIQGEGVSVTVAIQGGTSKDVLLPVGTYTVTLDTAWGWRYKSSDTQSATLTVSENGTDNSITLNPTVTNNKWFSGTAANVS